MTQYDGFLRYCEKKGVYLLKWQKERAFDIYSNEICSGKSTLVRLMADFDRKLQPYADVPVTKE